MGYLGTKPNTATSLADNIVTSDKINDGAVTPTDLSTGHPIWDSSNNLFVGGTTVATANSPVYSSTTAKAWACWTGSTGTINASFNVSSVTRGSTGSYTVNFTSAFADNKYVIAGSAEWNNGVSADAGIVYGGDSLKTTSSCRVVSMVYPSGAVYDATSIGIVCFR